MIASTQVPDSPRSYCFLYRDEEGVWHASSDSFHDEYDPATKTRHATIPIQKGRLSQLFLMSAFSGALLTKVTYRVAP